MSSQARQTSREAAAGAPAASAATASAQAILTATEELLGSHALRELSVAQIINRAGVSRATFYFHFASKFSVVAQLVEQAIEEMYEVSRVSHRDNPAASPATALAQRIRASARVWDDHRPVLKATVENWYAYPELGAAWLALIRGLTNDIAEELDHQPEARGGDSRAMGALLAWLTERCLYNVGVAEVVAPEERDRHLEALTAVWLAIMAPAESPPVALAPARKARAA